MENRAHLIKRAVIMAAGEGTRLRPVTESVPKPLIKVKQIRMIDSVIQGLHKNGISEIYIVTGYLKEQFDFLPKVYPGVELIENPYYKSCNNITSLYMARDHLEECMILDGDQMIYDPSVLDPHFELSGYNAVWCEGKTDEWLMQIEDGVVRSCSRNGGAHGWQLFSISRWSEEDGKKLKYWIEEEFEHGNRQIYWDDVPMFCHFDAFTLGIREMHKGAVVEIDSLQELALMDDSYAVYLK